MEGSQEAGQAAAPAMSSEGHSTVRPPTAPGGICRIIRCEAPEQPAHPHPSQPSGGPGGRGLPVGDSCCYLGGVAKPAACTGSSPAAADEAPPAATRIQSPVCPPLGTSVSPFQKLRNLRSGAISATDSPWALCPPRAPRLIPELLGGGESALLAPKRPVQPHGRAVLVSVG